MLIGELFTNGAGCNCRWKLGFDEAIELIGERSARRGMWLRFNRPTEENARLTRKEYVDAASEYTLEVEESPELYWSNRHRQIVEEVYKADPTKVPDEVLRDYPDLYLAKEPEPVQDYTIWSRTEPAGPS
jgi:hypothetical protein